MNDIEIRFSIYFCILKEQFSIHLALRVHNSWGCLVMSNR